MPYHRLLKALFFTVFAVLSLQQVQAQDPFAPGPIALPQSAPDFVLIDVIVVLKGTMGDKAKDTALIEAAKAAAAFGPGDRYNQILADGIVECSH